jgi:7,8-dihydropterin-6-yl-methyl-4-(beta-D-ribofuranosyl)aminobenzene 5'-phosphate synthase
MKKLILSLLFAISLVELTAQDTPHRIKNLKITILSTMLAEHGSIGEWGFSALVEADSIKILFDTGNGQNQAVLENSKKLDIQLADVQTLILSHWHGDHTGSWLPLRNEIGKINKNAFSVTHTAEGLFDTRIRRRGGENNLRQQDSLLYTRTDGQIIVHRNFDEIFPGIYLTGPVPRKYPEKNYTLNGKAGKKKDALGNIVEDNIPEDMSLIIQTENGLVLLSGCGHSGLINTITYAKSMLPQQNLLAAIGGFHLLLNTDEQIKWTAEQLKETGLRYFMGAHCTGIEPVYQIREWAGLKRGECIVGSVGAIFELDKGFATGPLTR